MDLIRGMQVESAISTLKFTQRKGAALALKLLQSAIANANNNDGVDIDYLWVKASYVDNGPTLSRYMPAAHGRATPIKKRTSHLTIILEERR